MSEPDANFKFTVSAFLQEAGIACREIPRSDSKTPDLILDAGSPNATLLELKVKEDDPAAMQELDSNLSSGGVVSRSQPTNRWNTIDGIMRDAVGQMNELDPNRLMLRMVWVYCSGFDADLSEMRLKATLYGTQKLFVTGRPNIVTCHYFWDSTFFRHRASLDGVVISHKDEAQLNLNDHSCRFDDAIACPMATAFGSAVYHPQKYIRDNDFMLNDCNGPRNREADTLNYLRQKYELSEMQTINMGRHSAMMRVPKNG
jgi:hypothetical protein